jgi:hypothetical protein
VPAYEVERMEAPALNDTLRAALSNVVLDMKVLAETADADFAAALNPLTEAYEAWIVDQEARLANPTVDLSPYRLDAEDTLQQCRVTLARIRTGIDLLGRDPRAAETFRFCLHAPRELDRAQPQPQQRAQRREEHQAG